MGFRTIIEPFRIHSVELLLRHFTALRTDLISFANLQDELAKDGP